MEHMEQVEEFGFMSPALTSYLKKIIGILQLGIPAITIRTKFSEIHVYISKLLKQ